MTRDRAGEIHGTCEPAFQGVKRAFEGCFQEMGESGAGACVYLDGRPVVELWAGARDPAGQLPWQQDTLVHVYSVTKPMAALCLLVLADRGALDLEAPVAEHWPEMDGGGKEGLLVRWLLTHQAGLLALRDPLPGEAIFDWDRVIRALEAEPPFWPPGTQHGEHAYFFGHLVGELVKRLSGKSIGEFFRQEIAEPWGLDFHIGLKPEEETRCATVVGMDDGFRRNIFAEYGTIGQQALGNPPGLLDGEVINSPRWRRAEIPAVNGHGTAHAIARFYGALACGGEIDGVRLITGKTLGPALAIQASGPDAFLGFATDWGLGFMLDSDGFGMGGLGGALGWGNSDYRLGFAYVTHRMATDDRAMAVYQSVWQCMGLPGGP